MESRPDELLKIPPHQMEAEQSLLGGIILENAGIPAAVEILKGDEFYRDAHRVIFKTVLELFERNEPVDLVTVADHLQGKNRLEAIGGATYLVSLTEAVASAANVSAYARIVSEKALLRRLIQISNEIISWCYGGGKSVEEILDAAGASVFAVTESRVSNSYSPIRDIVKKSIETIDRLQEYRDSVSGVPSHYRDLDKLTAGFQPSDLIILAARPSMGKTAFALNLARNAALESGVPVGFFSLEMSKEALAMRLLCSEAKVNSQKIRTGFLSPQEAVQMLNAAGHFAEAPIFIDDTQSISPLELRAKARRMKADHGLGMLVVDYLQLMTARQGRDRSREQEISEISRTLKAIAKELGVPVIALSQLNRKSEERNEKRPQLSDLRESGAIEQDADLIIFIYRDEVYNPATTEPGVAEIIIGKQRNGPLGKVKLAYQNEYTRFEQLSYGT